MASEAHHSVARRRATVKDVAREAGVSASTVSNVLHDHPYVTADKRKAVEDAILTVGYRPSIAGRQLRSGRSDILALAIPDLRSPYYAELAHILNQEALGQGFTVLVDETGGNLDREREIAQGYLNHGIEGVIFCPVSLPLAELETADANVPIVLLGEHGSHQAFDHIAIDSIASAREATAHLVATGRQRFAFIGYQPDRDTGPGPFRLAGLRAELAAADIQLDESLVLEASEFTREQGERAAAELVKRVGEVDAIVCAADLLAIGAMSTLQRYGISIPNDVAILGWDDSPEGRFSWPSLTTVKHDLDAIAELAVRSVLSRMEDDTRTPREYVVNHRLVIRESTNPRSELADP